ncbi:hypothetical protein QA597_02120 [Marinilabiliaceae bacterium ANBcel2]|nr:hypothetical protein [Marinilabiliaceae bacterium ANBcel2]
MLLPINIFYFHRPKEMELPYTSINMEYEKSDNGYVIILKSDVLARNVYLNSPLKDLFFEDNYAR